jgi:phosphoribosylglycinamide formyltransferase 1
VKKFAVLYSGYGRGAKEIISDYINGYIKPKLNLVITTNQNTEALEIAKKANIPTAHIDKKKYESNEKFEQEVLRELKDNEIDYIFLAGYGHLVGATLLNLYKNKIANIHPSLLPSFKGHKNGLQQALEYGVKVVGITTHLVDEGMDSGKILLQDSIQVDGDDFKQLEYRIFRIGTILQVQTINKFFV